MNFILQWQLLSSTRLQLKTIAETDLGHSLIGLIVKFSQKLSDINYRIKFNNSVNTYAYERIEQSVSKKLSLSLLSNHICLGKMKNCTALTGRCLF